MWTAVTAGLSILAALLGGAGHWLMTKKANLELVKANQEAAKTVDMLMAKVKHLNVVIRYLQKDLDAQRKKNLESMSAADAAAALRQPGNKLPEA